MDIGGYRHFLKIKMDHARIAERRRKLWMGMTAATLVLLLMIGSVVYITFPWESEEVKDFVLSEYDDEGNVKETAVTRQNFYLATTKNLDTYLERIAVSSEKFATSVSNRAQFFTNLWNQAKEQQLEGTEETAENTESNGVAPPEVETVETAKDNGKCTLYGYDADGNDTSAEYTKEKFSDIVEINYKYWAEKEDIKDSTYVNFVKHFADRFTEAKTRTEASTKPNDKGNEVTVLKNLRDATVKPVSGDSTVVEDLKTEASTKPNDKGDATVKPVSGDSTVVPDVETEASTKPNDKGDATVKPVSGDSTVVEDVETEASTKPNDITKDIEALKDLEDDAVKNVTDAEETVKKAEKALNEAGEDDKARLTAELDNAKTALESTKNEAVEIKNKCSAARKELEDRMAKSSPDASNAATAPPAPENKEKDVSALNEKKDDDDGDKTSADKKGDGVAVVSTPDASNATTAPLSPEHTEEEDGNKKGKGLRGQLK